MRDQFTLSSTATAAGPPELSSSSGRSKLPRTPQRLSYLQLRSIFSPLVVAGALAAVLRRLLILLLRLQSSTTSSYQFNKQLKKFQQQTKRLEGGEEIPAEDFPTEE
ncbi:hypothetical protein Droror1_Dr00009193 [Drosera rotundifolia]